MRQAVTLATATGLALLGASDFAHAQEQVDRTGSRFTDDRFHGNNQGEERHTMEFLGRCVASQKADEVEAHLRQESNETWAAVMKFPQGRTRCLFGRDLASNYRTMRGAIAQGYYVMQNPQGAPPSISGAIPGPPPVDEQVAIILSASDDSKSDVVVDEFARCVVASDPMGADRLVRTEPKTKEEGKALGALSPKFGPCAFEGQELAFDREGLRNAMAWALARQSLGVKPELPQSDED